MKYLFIILLFFTIFTIAYADTIVYDREEIAWKELLKGGCAGSYCPSEFIENSLEETNGLLPPSEYEENSWDWIRSVCTYSPEICTK